jgi:hypothetical protein
MLIAEQADTELLDVLSNAEPLRVLTARPGEPNTLEASPAERTLPSPGLAETSDNRAFCRVSESPQLHA